MDAKMHSVFSDKLNKYIYGYVWGKYIVVDRSIFVDNGQRLLITFDSIAEADVYVILLDALSKPMKKKPPKPTPRKKKKNVRK